MKEHTKVINQDLQIVVQNEPQFDTMQDQGVNQKLSRQNSQERTKENDITPRTAGSKRSMQLRGLSQQEKERLYIKQILLRVSTSTKELPSLPDEQIKSEIKVKTLSTKYNFAYSLQKKPYQYKPKTQFSDSFVKSIPKQLGLEPVGHLQGSSSPISPMNESLSSRQNKVDLWENYQGKCPSVRFNDLQASLKPKEKQPFSVIPPENKKLPPKPKKTPNKTLQKDNKVKTQTPLPVIQKTLATLKSQNSMSDIWSSHREHEEVETNDSSKQKLQNSKLKQFTVSRLLSAKPKLYPRSNGYQPSSVKQAETIRSQSMSQTQTTLQQNIQRRRTIVPKSAEPLNSPKQFEKVRRDLIGNIYSEFQHTKFAPQSSFFSQVKYGSLPSLSSSGQSIFPHQVRNSEQRTIFFQKLTRAVNEIKNRNQRGFKTSDLSI